MDEWPLSDQLRPLAFDKRCRARLKTRDTVWKTFALRGDVIVSVSGSRGSASASSLFIAGGRIESSRSHAFSSLEGCLSSSSSPPPPELLEPLLNW